MPERGLEHAPSGRAKCKTCKEKIEKGELRWYEASSNPFKEGDTMKKGMHLSCLHYPKRGSGFAFKDVNGLDELTERERQLAEEAYEKAKADAAKPTARKKRKQDDDDVDIEVEVVKTKKAKKRNEDLDEIDTDPVVIKYSNMTQSELKDYLRHNEQLVTGKKGELVARCVDGEKNGRLGVCRLCGKGKLKLDTETGLAKCTGYYDDAAMVRVSCKFEAPLEDAPRDEWLDPLKDPKPSEAAKEELEEEKDALLSSKDMKKVKEALSEVDEDAPPKEKAQALVKLCKLMSIAIPEDTAKAQAEAGRCLMENRDADEKFSLVGAFEALALRFGSVEQKEKKLAAKEAARPKAKVEANSKLADLMEQLAELEGKAKDGENYRFKVRAMKQAAIAIRTVEFPIESGKQVSKGPQKVSGIGKATAEHIDEILETGTIPRLEELQTREAAGEF